MDTPSAGGCDTCCERRPTPHLRWVSLAESQVYSRSLYRPAYIFYTEGPRLFQPRSFSLCSTGFWETALFQRDKIQASVGSEPADAFYQCTGADRAAFAAAGTGAGVHNGTDNVIFAGSRDFRSPGFFAFRRSAWYKNRENAEIISTRSVRLPSLRSISL